MSWECLRCQNIVVAHPVRCDLCGALRPGGTPGAMLGAVSGRALTDTRDLVTEAHLRAIAIWYRMGAAIAGAVIGLLLLFRLADVIRLDYERGARLLGTLPLVLVLGLCAGLFFLGRRLGRFGNFARIVAVVLSALTLLGDLARLGLTLVVGGGFEVVVVVLGTLISGGWTGAVLWVLVSASATRICTPAYQDLIVDRPDQQPRVYSSPFFWIPFAALMVFGGLFLFGIFAAGYRGVVGR